jgi:hypothetical protein
MNRRYGHNRPYAAFDDDICRSANHHQMFYIVATHEHQPASGVNGCGIENLQARLTVASTPDERRGTATSAEQPQDDGKDEQSNPDTDHSHDQTVSIGPDKVFHHLCDPRVLFDISVIGAYPFEIRSNCERNMCKYKLLRRSLRVIKKRAAANAGHINGAVLKDDFFAPNTRSYLQPLHNTYLGNEARR